MDNSTIALLTSISVGGFWTTVKPLLIIIAAIVIFSLFVFKFYRSLASPDILKLELHKHAKKFGGAEKLMHIIFYIIENIVLIPILIFIWFIVLAIILLMVSKTHSPETVLITSLSFVAGVRIISYYSEEMSREMAKMVPFTLLGIFLVDYIAVFTIEIPIQTFNRLLSLWPLMLYYLVAVAVIELVMRAIQIVIKLREED